MKPYLLFTLLFTAIAATAQQDNSYEQLLKPVNEVQIADSLHINSSPADMKLLDSMTVKKWFAPILGLAKNNRLKNRLYYLAGKIIAQKFGGRWSSNRGDRRSGGSRRVNSFFACRTSFSSRSSSFF